MKLKFNPQRRDDTIYVSVDALTITINGYLYNLAPLAVNSFISIFDNGMHIEARRTAEYVEVTLPLPYTNDTDIDVMVSHNVELANGIVTLPGIDTTPVELISETVIDWSKASIPEPVLTQFELDESRYQKRAAVQGELLAWMAADNMSRVRNGTWTVAQLTGLLNDPAIKAAQTYMSTLSYELAAQAISTATVAELTPTIKASWINKLQEHYYSTP